MCLVMFGILLLIQTLDRSRAVKESTPSRMAVSRPREHLVEEAEGLAGEGKFEPALAKMDEAVDWYPVSAELRFKRAELRMKAEKYPEALADLNWVIGADSGNARAHRLRAKVKERLNDRPGADADNLRAEELEVWQRRKGLKVEGEPE
jgi:predicted Zn-dependent protease